MTETEMQSGEAWLNETNIPFKHQSRRHPTSHRLHIDMFLVQHLECPGNLDQYYQYTTDTYTNAQRCCTGIFRSYSSQWAFQVTHFSIFALKPEVQSWLCTLIIGVIQNDTSCGTLENSCATGLESPLELAYKFNHECADDGLLH